MFTDIFKGIETECQLELKAVGDQYTYEPFVMRPMRFTFAEAVKVHSRLLSYFLIVCFVLLCSVRLCSRAAFFSVLYHSIHLHLVRSSNVTRFKST